MQKKEKAGKKPGRKCKLGIKTEGGYLCMRTLKDAGTPGIFLHTKGDLALDPNDVVLESVTHHFIEMIQCIIDEERSGASGFRTESRKDGSVERYTRFCVQAEGGEFSIRRLRGKIHLETSEGGMHLFSTGPTASLAKHFEDVDECIRNAHNEHPEDSRLFVRD